jgi:hypothetical protein
MPYKDPVKQKQAQRRSYLKHKERLASSSQRNKINAQNKVLKKRKRIFVNKVKSIFGCRICNYRKCLSALEFHHIDSTQKDIAISRLISGNWSVASIKKEMRKCVVLCANCHREVHEELKEGKDFNWDS